MKGKSLSILLLIMVVAVSLAACSLGPGEVTTEPPVVDIAALYDTDKATALVREYLNVLLDPASYTAYNAELAEFLSGPLDGSVFPAAGNEMELLQALHAFYDPRVFPEPASFYELGADNGLSITLAYNLNCLTLYPVRMEKDPDRHLKRFELTELSVQEEARAYSTQYELDYWNLTCHMKGIFYTDTASYEVENPIEVHVTVDETGKHMLKRCVPENKDEMGVGALDSRLQSQ